MKKYSSRFVLLFLLLFACTLSSCASLLAPCENTIDATAVSDPIAIVCDRHDAYVMADSSLTPEQRELYLRTTEMLRVLVDEARAGADDGGG